MGSDRRETNVSDLKRPRANSRVSEVADWGSVNEKLLVKVVEIISKKGGAVRLGYTRDGGAYAVGVYAGSNYFTDYIRPSEDIEEYLNSVVESFEDYVPGGEQPAKKGSTRKA